MSGLKLGEADLSEVDKLKNKLQMASREEVVRHAIVLLQIATESADDDGTISIGKGENAVELCLRH